VAEAEEEEEEDRAACPFPSEIAVARFCRRYNVAVPSLLLPAYLVGSIVFVYV